MRDIFGPMELQRPNWISKGARIIVKGRNENGLWGEALAGSRRLAKLNWSADGKLLHEMQLDDAGRGHGFETERDHCSRIIWCAQWVHGAIHGPVMQFDEDGRPVSVTHFVRGSGTDIWITCGKVSEIREIQKGKLHGLMRWGDPERPRDEGYFVRGKRHGIFREWKPDGKLRPRFPHFYLSDEKVTRTVYERARSKDPSLIDYDPRDDSNRRTTPSVVQMALKEARYLRGDLTLLEHVRWLSAAPSPNPDSSI